MKFPRNLLHVSFYDELKHKNVSKWINHKNGLLIRRIFHFMNLCLLCFILLFWLIAQFNPDWSDFALISKEREKITRLQSNSSPMQKKCMKWTWNVDLWQFFSSSEREWIKKLCECELMPKKYLLWKVWRGCWRKCLFATRISSFSHSNALHSEKKSVVIKST